MMKNINFYKIAFAKLLIALLMAFPVSSQKPLIRINSAKQGFVSPVMTAEQRGALSHVAGNLVWQTDGIAGYYYDNGSTWTPLNTAASYTIGLHPELGGYVFDLSADGKHGLVAETKDQSISVNWYEAQNQIGIPANHSNNGQKFRDWRMPTKFELNAMLGQAPAIGGFENNVYWSSSESDYNKAWSQVFFNGFETGTSKNSNFFVRSVRAF